MSVKAATGLQVWIDGDEVSSWVHAVMLETAAGSVDITALGSSWQSRIGTMKSARLRLMMWADFDTAGWDAFMWSRLGTSVVVEVVPDPDSATTYRVTALVTQLQPLSSNAGQMAEASMVWPVTDLDRTVLAQVPVTYGLGYMSNEDDGAITNTFQDQGKKVNGSSHVGMRLAWGGIWRPAAPASVTTFNPNDFGILNPSGKLRSEVLKWITVQHAATLPSAAKLGLQYGTNMAIGVYTGSTDGPRNPTTGALDPSATWATRTSNPTYGVDPLPFIEVNAAGVAKPKYVTAPWGALDFTLSDGVTKASRFHVWLEQDLEALSRFFDEDCEVNVSSPTAAFRVAHKRRDHFPFVQVKACVNQDSLEYSRGFETNVNFYPAMSDASQITLVGSVTSSATSIPWSGTPPTSGTGLATWSPWSVASTTVSGRGCVIIYDSTDPANKWEAFPVTQCITNAGGTSGTFTVQTGGRGAFGPPARAWTQSGSTIRVALAQWTGGVLDEWVGTPGVGGAEVPQSVQVVDRSTFALTSLTTCIPVRLVNGTAMFAHAWKARADALAGGTVVWAVGDRQPSSGPSITGAENAPMPSTYTWTGTETETQVEHIVMRSIAEHARLAEFMVAKKLPRHRQVVYYGKILDDNWFEGWNGSAVFGLSRAYVAGLPATPLIPPDSFMARPAMKRTYSGNEHPWVWKSATEWWSVCDYLFAATALPHLVDPKYTGWGVRFAHGTTHFQTGLLADGYPPPWTDSPEDYGGWHLLKNQWKSTAMLVMQMKAVTGGGIPTGAQMVRTMEDAWSYDDTTVRPVTIEGNWTRYTASGLDFSAAYVPSGALGGGWAGSANTTQQNYLLGTTNADPSVDSTDGTKAIGRRVRTNQPVTQV